MSTKAKKPFYKKWWVWGIVLILVIAFSTGDTEEQEKTDAEAEEQSSVNEASIERVDKMEESTNDTADESEEALNEKEAKDDGKIESGTYKVGEDISAGEYLVFSEGMAYIESSSDSTGNLESIVFNANLMGDSHSYVSLNDGEYFKLQGAAMYPAESAPAVIPEDGVYQDGMYKVGQDIPAGEYKVLLNDTAAAGMGYLEVSSDSSHQLGSIVTNENVQADTYITVSDGQYLTLQDLSIEK
ncbi:hypothetical protein [Oceanobacillus massiliensis]|uniref:hypothetical protein n=1 Tax=Oceanobacillus massiliensis TaxID=1465765 RepID=UPI00301A5A5B